MEAYGDKVRFVFKHNPLSFHDKAMLAAEAAMEAQKQGKFWEYHDTMFEGMPALERADLDGYAETVGLDMKAFGAALDSHVHKERIMLDQADAGEVKASGTPSFYINGKKLSGSTVDDFKAMIDDELKETGKLLKAGTPASEIYAKRIAKGKVFKTLEDKVNTFAFEGSPSIGKAPAKITITEFSDFQ